jgi:hypothetical protein
VTHQGDESGSLGSVLADLLESDRRDDVCVVDIRVPFADL